MTARRQWLVVGVVLAALGGALAVGVSLAPGAKIIGPGSVAPDFAGTTVPDSGASVIKGIAAYRGQPVLLNMWATWCAPCRDEMPRIEQLHRRFGDSLQVVAVSIDNPGMTDAIRDFRKEMGLTFEILHDESGRMRDDYQTTGVPETFLIDRNGVVRRRMIGAAWTIEDQLPLLRELIAEKGR